MEITEQEFQKALIVVNTYIDNLNKNARVPKQKTTITDWINYQIKVCDKMTGIHNRLFNALNQHLVYWTYIEDIEIKKIAGVGKQTIDLFNQLNNNFKKAHETTQF